MVIIKKFDKRLLMCKFTNSHKFQLYIAAATEKLCYELKVKIKLQKIKDISKRSKHNLRAKTVKQAIS